MNQEKSPILEIQDLSVSFSMYDGKMSKNMLQVNSNLSLRVYP